MQQFSSAAKHLEGGLPVSIKVRVISGCFHREHSPCAYHIIDEYLADHAPQDVCFSFQEHESGPEILVYFAASVTLVTSIINLITTLVKARKEGIKKGDHPSAPVEIIIRGHLKEGEYFEERILRLDAHDPVSRELIGKALNDSVSRLSENDGDCD